MEAFGCIRAHECHDVQMFFWRIRDVEVLAFWERLCRVHTPAVEGLMDNTQPLQE